MPRVVAAAVVLALAGGGVYLMRRAQQGRRQTALLKELMPAIDAGNMDRVWTLLDERAIDVGASGLARLAGLVSGELAIETRPTDVAVTAVRVGPIETFEGRPSLDLGRTPLVQPLVAGEYLLLLERGAERDPLTLLVTVDVGRRIELHRELEPPLDGRDMARVGAGPSPLAPNGAEVPAFLIDRYEVTNEDYLKFIDDGGYGDAAYWPESVVIDGRALPWSEAVGRFVDRTGRPGPRGWSRGTYPAGRERHPVTGVTWYEAMAYATWAGMELPTRDQWWRAALVGDGRVYPWGRDGAATGQRANFNLDGTDPVGSHPLGVSSTGCFDLAGNAGEWLRDADARTGKRLVAGGSWQVPVSLFADSQTRRLDADHADEAIGFRLVAGAGDERP